MRPRSPVILAALLVVSACAQIWGIHETDGGGGSGGDGGSSSGGSSGSGSGDSSGSSSGSGSGSSSGSGQCSVFPQGGCGANATCVPYTATMNNCIQNVGNHALGLPCTEASDCQSQDVCYQGACHKFCSPIGSTCAGLGSCVAALAHNGDRLTDVGICQMNCDMVSGAPCGCSGGTCTNCGYDCASQGTDCTTAGTDGLGTGCTYSQTCSSQPPQTLEISTCQYGLYCARNTGTTTCTTSTCTCRQLCDCPAGNCSAGSCSAGACQPFSGAGFMVNGKTLGVCL